MDELSRWAKDELRSVNAQIEYVLRDATRRRRRKFDEPEQSGDAESRRANPET